MGFFWTFLLLASLGAALARANSMPLTPALFEGAAEGCRLSISLAGPLCLWSAFSSLLQETAADQLLTRLTAPLLCRLFPSGAQNPAVRRALSGNFLANLLGMGNAATPLGIEAARHLPAPGGRPGDELCRLVILNTASVQLLPTTVAALRSSLGAAAPFDLLICVWLTSLGALAVGLTAGRLLSRWVP